MDKIDFIFTDLDGTLLKEGEKPHELGTFRYALNTCRTNWDTKWAIITGRRFKDTHPVITYFLGYGLRPDFLITEDGLIYKRNQRGRFNSFLWWNFNIKRKRFHMGRRNTSDIIAWRDELLRQYPTATDRSRQTVDLWLEFDNEEESQEAESFLREKIADTAGFQVYRWKNELFLAFSIGTKGQAVDKLRETLNLDPGYIFAVGDGPNDLSMLEHQSVGMPSCVGNALDKVKKIVQQQNGYVAEREGAAGVAEAIQNVIKD